jgi:DNA-binding NtrC family response regulator
MGDWRRLKLQSLPPSILVAAAKAEKRRELADILLPWPSLGVPPTGTSLLDNINRYPSIRLIIIIENKPDREALDLLNQIKACNKRVAVLIMSTNPTIEHATEAVRRGAEDFIPIHLSVELLKNKIAKVLETDELRNGINEIRRQPDTFYGFEQIISNSPRMNPVFQRARAASRSDTPILITGETGTGKELLARAIHANSRRHNRPFVAVNCAAIPHELIESELFGHRKGSFSGAHADHCGLFFAAHHGTLMLDEIGELAASVQAKLLRVLQNNEVRPVGALKGQLVDVRVIAATNRSIPELRNGVLRQDLFYRMSVLVIEIPLLRERQEDIPHLIEYFLSRFRSSVECRLCNIEPAALELLMHHSFPGNIRELENFVRSMAATVGYERETINVEDVRGWMRRQGLWQVVLEETAGLPLDLKQLENWAISAALTRSKGNKSRAAALLGISRDSLYRKLHEIDQHRQRPQNCPNI